MHRTSGVERWVNRAASAVGVLVAAAVLWYGLGRHAGQETAVEVAQAAVDGAVHADHREGAPVRDGGLTEVCCPADAAPGGDVHAEHDHAEHDHAEHADEAAEAEADAHAGHDHGSHFTNAEGVIWCGEHDVAEAECAICQPDRVAALQPGEGMKLRLASGEAARAAGVQVAQASVGAAASAGRLLGRITYNESRLAHITPMVTGVIREVRVELGQTVEAGQPLARVASPDIAEARRAFQSAQAATELAANVHAREKELHAKRISSERDYRQAAADLRQAESAVTAARQSLLDLGLTPDELGGGGRDASTVTLRAPFDGVVIEQHAVLGEAVGPDEPIFQVADLSTMWLDLSAPESMIEGLRPGARIVARFDALPGRELDAELAWVASILDESSRTLRARAVVSNEDGLLKSGMFGRAELVDGSRTTAVYVPEASVQKLIGGPVVFVHEADDLYEVRRVATGRRTGSDAEIAGGLEQGEPVVVAQSFALKSELLKAQLGAGCVHD